ncbi:molybdopterin synthase sulfur carrier subunit [Sodalis sp. RH22]|uniref:molybdopterin synthase sulfur carrier subunit n=1 Tax=unclassified Sodalis (in: enterobacteria) TaxID=2636512 RepID=UPI0039B5FD0F
MITVLFFAQVRERVGVESLRLDDDYGSVEALRLSLMARGDRWAQALDADQLLTAVNQALVPREHPLASGDEVAFFPPVTGG